MALYVIAESRENFRRFCQDFGIWADTTYVYSPRQLRGVSPSIVLIPGRYTMPPQILAELRANPMLSLIEVNDTAFHRRQRLDYSDRGTYRFTTRYIYNEHVTPVPITELTPGPFDALSVIQTPTNPPPAPPCNCRPECLCTEIENS